MLDEPQDVFDSDDADVALREELQELTEAEAFAKAHIRMPYGREDVVIEPLQDRVVLRVKDKPTSNIIGHLVLPDKYIGKTLIGEVIAVGPGTIRKKDGVRVPPTLRNGDEVIYHEFGGEEFQFGERGDYKYRVIRERDCLAVLT